MKTYILALLFICLFSCTKNEKGVPVKPIMDIPLINEDLALNKIIDSLSFNKNNLHISIDKSAYRLFVKADNTIVKEYPVVFGGNPVDDKRMEGDKSTPEGIFKVRNFYPHNKWSKFIWIDYPTKESWEKHNQAKADGLIPKDATIGGEVGIHGVPEGKDAAIDQKINWTLGCISLKNKDVDELYTVIRNGMEIEILP